jgi:DNA repair exonuclease SbcCD nuclease subunit
MRNGSTLVDTGRNINGGRLKFIHAADIHLDSPLVGLSAYQDAPADLLRLATRSAFENLVAEAIAEEVDFMIIAGDLYDGPWRDFNTGLFFAREMGRLNAAGIPVYLLMGNHDAESEMTKRLVLPPNVFKFDAKKPQTYKIEKLRVALHGRSFKDAATTENLAVTYPASVQGWFNIGVLHTAALWVCYPLARLPTCRHAAIRAKPVRQGKKLVFLRVWAFPEPAQGGPAARAADLPAMALAPCRGGL